MRRLLYSSVLLVLFLGITRTGYAQGSAFTLEQVLTYLRGGLFTSAEILTRVRGNCVAFQMTNANETALRTAGADATLIAGLREEWNRCNPASRGGATPTPTMREDTVLIEGTLPPGWSRVVNQLEPSQNRLITLTRDGFVILSAPGWCEARDTLVYRPGETTRWTPTLRARPWLGGC